MRAINYIFKVIFIFISMLAIISAAILYVRPDIKPQDFFQNWKFWIVPVVLLYLILNFKSILAKTINKILITSILIWAGYFFYPNIMNEVKPYTINYFGNSTDKIKNTLNDMATPKDGSKPIVQINSSNKNKEQNDSVHKINNNIDLTNKEHITKNLPQLSNEQIKELAQKPIEYLSNLAELAPPEAKQRLEKIGIDIKNPTQSIMDIVGKDQKKQRNAITNFFK